MPCNSDYMNPTDRERRLQETAQLFAYALTTLGHSVPKQVQEAAKNIYCTADFVPNLCALLSGLDDEQLSKVAYNARSKESRKLADWWEEHQVADQKRIEKERRLKQKELLRKSALSKLTKEEFDALFNDEDD